MTKVRRNDPCPCGSGKKYKNCHEKEDIKAANNNKAYLIGAILIIFIIIAAVVLFTDSNNSQTSKPPGPAPEGKVWSEEHGHYH
jgi:hypothetical protein